MLLSERETISHRIKLDKGTILVRLSKQDYSSVIHDSRNPTGHARKDSLPTPARWREVWRNRDVTKLGCLEGAHPLLFCGRGCLNSNSKLKMIMTGKSKPRNFFECTPLCGQKENALQQSTDWNIQGSHQYRVRVSTRFVTAAWLPDGCRWCYLGMPKLFQKNLSHRDTNDFDTTKVNKKYETRYNDWLSDSIAPWHFGGSIDHEKF